MKALLLPEKLRPHGFPLFSISLLAFISVSRLNFADQGRITAKWRLMEYFSQTFRCARVLHCRFFYFDYPDKSDKHELSCSLDRPFNVHCCPPGFLFRLQTHRAQELFVWQRRVYLG